MNFISKLADWRKDWQSMSSAGRGENGPVTPQARMIPDPPFLFIRKLLGTQGLTH